MLVTVHTPEEVGRLGDKFYHREIRPRVMPQCKGKFLTIDVRPGEYEIDDDDLTATRRLQARMQSLLALNEAGLLDGAEQSELDELQEIEHVVISLKARIAADRMQNA